MDRRGFRNYIKYVKNIQSQIHNNNSYERNKYLIEWVRLNKLMVEECYNYYELYELYSECGKYEKNLHNESIKAQNYIQLLQNKIRQHDMDTISSRIFMSCDPHKKSIHIDNKEIIKGADKKSVETMLFDIEI